MIILPWVCWSVLRGNLKRVWKTFCGILVLHTESMISLADLRPKSQRIYVGHMNLLLLHISFVSRGFMPVSFDLNLCIHPELLHIVFCNVIY